MEDRESDERMERGTEKKEEERGEKGKGSEMERGEQREKGCARIRGGRMGWRERGEDVLRLNIYIVYWNSYSSYAMAM